VVNVAIGLKKAAALSLLGCVLAEGALGQQQHAAPPAPRPSAARTMIATSNSMEELNRRFAQLDARRFSVRTSPRIVNPEVAHPSPRPEVKRALQARGVNPGQMQPAMLVKQRTPPASAQSRQSVAAGPTMCRGITEIRTFSLEPYNDMLNLHPNVSYTIRGCNYGTVKRELRFAGLDPRDPVIGAGASTWTDNAITFSLAEKSVYDFAGSLITLDTQTALLPGIYYAPRVSTSVGAIPAGAITVQTSPAGSPYVSSPLTNYYGLSAPVGVARQAPGGLLPGQDTIQLRLAPDVLVESVQIQYLQYGDSGATSLVTGTSSQAVLIRQIANDAKIIVNWPVSSVTLPGQQPMYYSVYGLSITLKGPKGMPLF